jgi:hypothetical protein
MLERFTVATFAERLGETFRVYPDAGDATRCLDMALIETTDLSARDRQQSVDSERRAPFSVVFRGPATPILPQRIYRIEHPEIGSCEIFLVPIGPDEQGLHYEAIFT